MTDYLLDESPLVVLPSLAKLFQGADTAIVFQQVHYWMQRSEHEMDGRKWIYNTYDQWQAQFPWLSTRTIQRIFQDLEARGLLTSTMNYNSRRGDRTKWYSINRDALNAQIAEHRASSCQTGSIQADSEANNHMGSCQVGTSNMPDWHEADAKLAHSSIEHDNTADSSSDITAAAAENSIPEPKEKEASNVMPIPLKTAVREGTSCTYDDLYSFFKAGYREIYSARLIITDNEKKAIRGLVEIINGDYLDDLGEVKAKFDRLREIAEARNQFQPWRFLPSAMLKHWNDLSDKADADQRLRLGGYAIVNTPEAWKERAEMVDRLPPLEWGRTPQAPAVTVAEKPQNKNEKPENTKTPTFSRDKIYVLKSKFESKRIGIAWNDIVFTEGYGGWIEVGRADEFLNRPLSPELCNEIEATLKLIQNKSAVAV